MDRRQCTKLFETVSTYKYQREMLTSITEVYGEISRIHSAKRLVSTVHICLTG
jgi:hypothetical protein